MDSLSERRLQDPLAADVGRIIGGEAGRSEPLE